MARLNAKIALGCSVLMLASQACTDLTEKTFDVIPVEGFGNTPAQQAALIGPLYAGVRGYFGNLSNLNAATDEQIVPTRGGDWKDGDQWKRIYEHSWQAVADGGTFFNGAWGYCYNNITAVNQQLATAKDPALVAELRALRAFFHYSAMDWFGNAIIADALSATQSKQSTRAEMFAYIEKELLAIYPQLSAESGGAFYGRMNKPTVDMLLAKLYLNAQVYTGTPRWQDAVTRLNNIVTTGKYSLPADFFSTFSTNNSGSPEIIFAVPFDRTKAGGMNLQMRTLHYRSQLTYNLGSSPWNGFATPTEFYNSFDARDTRKQMWIVGQQFDASGKPLDDDGVPMVFNPEIPAFAMPAGAAGRLAGARSQKYQIQRNNTFNDQDNDFVIFRYADVLLMRGEAQFRLGNTAAALTDFNLVRARAGMPAYTTATLTLPEILAERGRELAWEYHRRQDLIRFDQFTKAWRFKPASAKFRELFPIPNDQIILNTNLKQNPGY